MSKFPAFFDISISLLTIGILLQLLFVGIHQCEAAKFFFTFFHDKGSHFGSMRPMMERLAEKGHSVTFLDTIHSEDVSLPPLQHIHATLTTAKELPRKQRADIMWQRRITASDVIKLYKNMDNLFGTLLLNHTEKIVNITNEGWDVIVIDDLFWSFGFALTTLQHRLWELEGKQRNVPLIIPYTTSAQSLLSMESTRSFGRNWVSRPPLCPYLPTDLRDVYSPSKFIHRLHAFGEVFTEFVLLNFYVTPFLMPNIEQFGVPNFSWYELYARSALGLSDMIDRVGWAQPAGTELVNVGAHCKQPNPGLNAKFADFIEDPKSNGTIFLAFGTHVDWSDAPARVIDAMFGALNRLNAYRIIFVYNGPMPRVLGTNVMLTKWAPQKEILAHPRTKAFISHGGNKSVREALCAGVPLIIMPIYAEQAHSAHLLLAMDFAPVINKFTLTEQSVYGTISEVVQNPARYERARKYQRMFLDRLVPALDEGVFGMERLMRQRARSNGDQWRRYTQRRGMHLGWMEFTFADWAILLYSIIGAITLLQ